MNLFTPLSNQVIGRINMLWDLFDNLGNRFCKKKENLPKHDKVYVREDVAESIVNKYDIQKGLGE